MRNPLSNPAAYVVLTTVVVVFAALWVRKCTEDSELLGLRLTSSNAIDLTPAQIRSIERIGQWEFLAIDDEELVDTIRHRTL